MTHHTTTSAERGASRIGTALVLAVIAAALVTGAFAYRSLDLAAETAAGPGPTASDELDDAGSDGGSASEPPEPATDGTTTSTLAPTSTTTTVPPTTIAPTTTTTTAPPPPSYRSGDSGPEVAALQQRLIDLGFWLPGVDGDYGSVTSQAVMAFQKFVGIGRDGIAGPATLAALETAGPAGPREGGDHIEVDLERQIMFVVRGGTTYVFNTSTGTSGWLTPPGRFEITRVIDGVRHAPLGDLYRPRYFNGGIALHGSPSIPGHAASHGCTRLHNAAVDFIWANDLAPIGTPVWVY